MLMRVKQKFFYWNWNLAYPFQERGTSVPTKLSCHSVFYSPALLLDGTSTWKLSHGVWIWSLFEGIIKIWGCKNAHLCPYYNWESINPGVKYFCRSPQAISYMPISDLLDFNSIHMAYLEKQEKNWLSDMFILGSGSTKTTKTDINGTFTVQNLFPTWIMRPEMNNPLVSCAFQQVDRVLQMSAVWAIVFLSCSF